MASGLEKPFGGPPGGTEMFLNPPGDPPPSDIPGCVGFEYPFFPFAFSIQEGRVGYPPTAKRVKLFRVGHFQVPGLKDLTGAGPSPQPRIQEDRGVGLVAHDFNASETKPERFFPTDSIRGNLTKALVLYPNFTWGSSSNRRVSKTRAARGSGYKTPLKLCRLDQLILKGRGDPIPQGFLEVKAQLRYQP